MHTEPDLNDSDANQKRCSGVMHRSIQIQSDNVRQKEQKATSLSVSENQDADLVIARKIHAAMVPKCFPTAEGLELASLYLPCGAVGGDLYDVVQLSDDVLAFLIFDVTGFGISSALISAMAKVCFANHLRSGVSPRAVIERVNAEIIREVSADFYLTAFLGYLDLHDNRLTYSNAGHAYPVVYRKASDSILSLKTQGTLLGVFDNGFFEEQSVYLNPGDCLVLITDGIYRIFSENIQNGKKLFEEKVREVLGSASPKELIAFVREQYDILKAGKGTEDDITALTAEVLTQSRKNLIKENLGFSRDEPVYLQFISYYEEMDRAVATVLSSMDMFGFADEAIRKMKITLTELLVNAILHGNKRDFSRKVTMGHVVDRKKAVISILDEGEGFDPSNIPDPTLPENLAKDCGRGLFIVRHYADCVTFNEKGNRVTVTKYHALD